MTTLFDDLVNSYDRKTKLEAQWVDDISKRLKLLHSALLEDFGVVGKTYLNDHNEKKKLIGFQDKNGGLITDEIMRQVKKSDFTLNFFIRFIFPDEETNKAKGVVSVPCALIFEDGDAQIGVSFKGHTTWFAHPSEVSIFLHEIILDSLAVNPFNS